MASYIVTYFADSVHVRYLPIGIGEVHGMVMHASLPSWLGQSRKLPFSAWILTVLGSLGLLSSRPENVL